MTLPSPANDNRTNGFSEGSLAIAGANDAKSALIDFVRALAVRQARLDAANDNGVGTVH